MAIFLITCLWVCLIAVVGLFITMWLEYTIVGRAVSHRIERKIKGNDDDTTTSD